MARPKSTTPAFFQPGYVTYLRGILILLFSIGAWLSSHYLIAPKVHAANLKALEEPGVVSLGFSYEVFEFMTTVDQVLESTFVIWFGILVVAFLAVEIWFPAWKRMRRTFMGFLVGVVSISTIVWLWFLAMNASLRLPSDTSVNEEPVPQTQPVQ